MKNPTNKRIFGRISLALLVLSSINVQKWKSSSRNLKNCRFTVINSRKKWIYIVAITIGLVLFGVASTYPRVGLGKVEQTVGLNTSSEQNLVDKVFTFLAPNDTLRFDDFYLFKSINYYVLLEIVTPHNCEINATIIDPVLDVYEVFQTEVNISQNDDWFEIPFGTAVEGNYSFIISVACELNLNLHVKISFDSVDKCLYDMISPQFLETMKLYQVNKFTNGMVVEHNIDLRTDVSYKFYLGRVSAIGGLTVEDQVRVFYDVIDDEDVVFTIYQNKTVGSVGTMMHFDFGTAVEGIYSVKIQIYCQVDVVNIAYAISEDYQISNVNNGTDPDPDPDPQTNETLSGYFYVPAEWTLGFGIVAGVVLGILTIFGVLKRRDDSVTLKPN